MGLISIVRLTILVQIIKPPPNAHIRGRLAVLFGQVFTEHTQAIRGTETAAASLARVTIIEVEDNRIGHLVLVTRSTIAECVRSKKSCKSAAGFIIRSASSPFVHFRAGGRKARAAS